MAIRFSIISSIILPFSFNANAALSATTANTIQGTTPKIMTKASTPVEASLDDIVSVFMPDGTTQLSPTGTTSYIVQPSNTLAQITSYIKYEDTDGDIGDSAYKLSGIDGLGGISFSWTDSYGETVSNLNANFDGCLAPYTLTVNANNAKAVSKYGDPIDNNYGTQSQSYTIRVADYKKCYIKPLDMTINASCATAGNCKYTSGYNSAVFVPKKGFLPTALPTFPRTGFNQAKFTLKMSNAQSDYTYSSNNAIVSISNAAGSEGEVTFNSTSKPNPLPTVILSATLKDSPYTAVTYTFTLNKWARVLSGVYYYGDTMSLVTSTVWPAASACKGSAVTSKAEAATYFFSRTDIVNSQYVTGAGTGGAFSRDADNTFLGEWGSIYKGYLGSGFESGSGVWTSDAFGTDAQYVVGTTGGNVFPFFPAAVSYVAACK